jgi:hypothetical protein
MIGRKEEAKRQCGLEQVGWVGFCILELRKTEAMAEEE